MATAKDTVTVEDTDTPKASKAEIKAALEEKRNANDQLLEIAHSKAEEIVDAEESVDSYAERVADFKRKQEQAQADYEAQLPKQKAEQELDRAEKLPVVPLAFDFSTNDAGQVVEPQVLEVQDRKRAEGEIRSDKERVSKRVIEGVPETGI